MRRRRVAALLPVVVVSCLACAPPEQIRYEREVREAPATSLHAVHDERLRTLMRDIARLQRERLPQSLDARGEARRRAADVARVASALADSATRIAGTLPGGTLSAEEREAFVREARALEERARSLARDAPTLAPEALEARVAAIEAVCEACHTRFRVPR